MNSFSQPQNKGKDALFEQSLFLRTCFERLKTVLNSSNYQKKEDNFARAAHFFVHFCAVVLQDYRVKLLLSSYTF